MYVNKLRFIVTGTGRSGTGYTASALTANGVLTGHESWFSYRAGVFDHQVMPRYRLRAKAVSPFLRVREEYRRRTAGVVGDASWMAVPRLHRFSGVVLLQLRHPLSASSSILGSGFFSGPEPVNAYERFARAHFAVTGEPQADAVRFWCDWNSWASGYARGTYALESLDEPLMQQILRLVDPVGSDRRSEALQLSDLPRNDAVSRGQSNPVLAWSDLPVNLRNRVTRLCADWGYTPDDPTVAPPAPRLS